MVREPNKLPSSTSGSGVPDSQAEPSQQERKPDNLQAAFDQLLQWAIAHTELGASVLRPEDVTHEHQARLRFQDSLQAGRQLIASCQFLRDPHPLLVTPPRPAISSGLGAPLLVAQDSGSLLGVAPAPALAARRDGMLPMPLSGSMRFGGDPMLGMPLSRNLNLPEDLAKRRHNLAPSRSYSKKKAAY